MVRINESMMDLSNKEIEKTQLVKELINNKNKNRRVVVEGCVINKVLFSLLSLITSSQEIKD